MGAANYTPWARILFWVAVVVIAIFALGEVLKTGEGSRWENGSYPGACDRLGEDTLSPIVRLYEGCENYRP